MKQKTSRCGLGKGLGKGYKNLVPKDPYVHRMSALGVKVFPLKRVPYGELNPNLPKSKREYVHQLGNSPVGTIKEWKEFAKKSGVKKLHINELDGSEYDITLKAQITRIQGTADKQELANELQRLLKHRGYDAMVYVDKGHIELRGVRLSEEYLDTKGYNISSSTGRRGRILNWENWVEVNDTINDVMDKYNVSANASSLGGKFKIRQGTKRFGRDDWEELETENVGSIMNPVYRTEAWQPEGVPRKKKGKKLNAKGIANAEVYYAKMFVREHPAVYMQLHSSGDEPVKISKTLFKKQWKKMSKDKVMIDGKVLNEELERMFAKYNDSGYAESVSYSKGRNPLATPKGQKRVDKSGTSHTSMSVGDMVKVGDDVYMVAPHGFKKVEIV
jgi:hypothetical protein